uniref:CAP_N domain-containing protein n=1 Tax=Caenorhabditis tropicalis TaxID=1561998 RepID=A0A1I7TZ72_9PELO
MDSLYYSAPRPFNKYPRGYRPVTDSTQDLRSFGGGLRPSSSWSSFPQQLVTDQRSATLPHFPSSCVSPASPLSPVDRSTNYWTSDEPPRSRRPIRSESNSTVFDNNFSPREFSPRELSPLSVASEYCNNPMPPTSTYGHRSVQSPVQAYQEPAPRGYDNVPRPPVYESHTMPSQRETDFLRNLQRQKVEAQSMSSSWYGGDQPSRQPDWNPTPNPPQQPRRLAKTQSDLSFDSLNNTYFNNNPVSSVQTPNETNQGGLLHNSINNYNSNGNNGNQGHRMDGFFRNRVIEPNWMTDPPPPKSFREDYIIRNVPISTSMNSDFERFRLDPSYREPTRATSVATEQPNFRSYHRDGPPSPPSVQSPNHQVVQPEINYQRAPHYMQQREPSPVRSPPVISYAHQANPFSFPNPINQVNYNQEENLARAPTGGYQDRRLGSTDRPNVYQNVPPTAAVAFREKERPASQYLESNRNSAIYQNEPIRLTNDRVLRIHPLQPEQDNHQVPEEPHYAPPTIPHSQRARIQSPLRDYARLTSPIREVAPQPRVSSPDRIFSPVESKVFNRSGPTVINGFTSNRHTYNSHTDDYEARNRRDSSQPPVAVIEPNINVHMPSDPIPYTKPHFGHHHTHNHGHNVHPVKPTTHYSNPTFSPNSNYDNDSDLDIEEMARRALPRYLRDNEKTGRHGNLYGDNLHGILIKNPSLHRSSSKKVVFIDQDKASAGAAASGEVPAHVRAYDDALEEPLSNWTKLTDQIGGDVAAIKPKVLAIFDSLRNYLWTAAGKQEPSAEEAQKMLTPIINLLGEINNFKDAQIKTAQPNHLKSIAEALPALGWLTVKKTPAPYIKEYVEASQFYINKILREFKDTDPRHVEWTKAWKGIFDEMQKFVRQVHTTGLVWNSAPGSAPAAISGSSAPAAAPKAPGGPGGPPPPPPPPPADFFANIAPPPVDTEKSNRDALFAQLNQGEGVTSRLKKVTADMQTHKNPNLRGNTAAPASAPQGGASPARPAAAPVRKPPHKELENGKQWIVVCIS